MVCNDKGTYIILIFILCGDRTTNVRCSGSVPTLEPDKSTHTIYLLPLLMNDCLIMHTNICAVRR